MSQRDDSQQLRTIQQAARTVGESLDWVDHGGGERAWTLIREQPAVVRQAHEALSAELRTKIAAELLEQFERSPELYWSRLEDAAVAALEAIPTASD